MTSTLTKKIDKCINLAKSAGLVEHRGQVSRVVGLVIESIGPKASVGSTCWVGTNKKTIKSRAVEGDEERRELKVESGEDKNPISHLSSFTCSTLCSEPVLCEVVGFRDNRLLLMPLGELSGISPGSKVIPTGEEITIGVGDGMLGRVIGGMGEPVDGKGPLDVTEHRPLYAQPPHPLHRSRVSEPLPTGIRAIDAFLTCGKGQRIGIFSAAGVGKSMLLGQIAKCSRADVNVIALIGERGREVREFIEKYLGPEGLKKSVVVVVTSDQHSLLRLKGALTAMTIAEFFRDQGNDVLFAIDSITRVARAQRELGLAIGEAPALRGYTPSVFELLPKLAERAAAGLPDRVGRNGSITGVFTVLVEGDDLDEPVSDIMRATIDGHIVLSRKLATRHHFPAVDVLTSVSRCMPDIVDGEHYAAAAELRMLYAGYEDARDMISLGAYVSGSNAEIDTAIELTPRLEQFLRQLPDEVSDFRQTRQHMLELAKSARSKDLSVSSNQRKNGNPDERG